MSMAPVMFDNWYALTSERTVLSYAPVLHAVPTLNVGNGRTIGDVSERNKLMFYRLAIRDSRS